MLKCWPEVFTLQGNVFLPGSHQRSHEGYRRAGKTEGTPGRFWCTVCERACIRLQNGCTIYMGFINYWPHIGECVLLANE